MARDTVEEDRKAREGAVRRSQREAAAQRAERYFQRMEAERRQDIRYKASAAQDSDSSLPDGWKKIPWEIAVNPYNLDEEVLEPHNPARQIPMFDIGDILQTRYKGKRTMQVVNRYSYEDEYHYCVIRSYGKNARWFAESDFKWYSIMRKWGPDMRKKYINPKFLKRKFKKGTRLQLVFNNSNPSTAKLYSGTITEKMRTKTDANTPSELYITRYTLNFDDGDVLQPTMYRLLWMLEETSMYLDAHPDDIPIADVGGEYLGDDIPLALPGLKLRF